MSLCWPDASFEQHMRRVWITDSVLCSAEVEGGSVPRPAAVECRSRYLEAQLNLFPNATVAALGRKACRRLAGRRGVLQAFAVAPPGCNFRGARPSWEAIARSVRERPA